jgi:Methane oxygenase PmoA
MRTSIGGVCFTLLLFTVLLACCVAVGQNPADERIRLVVHEDQRRVDILINGQPFTSYIWPTTLDKPVLYPLRTARGTVVTRGYPLEPRPGERTDHPHHAGLWFNYGSVNGIDFWNNSDAIKPEDKHKMGTVYHRKIVTAKGGSDSGVLEVEADWNTADQKTLLKERTRLVFRGDTNTRIIDRISTLTAQSEKVVFEDDKEGLLGMRVARPLEMPSDKPEVLTDASGRPTTVPRLDNAGVNGVYLTSEGKTGDAAWGTRGKWCNLSAQVEGEAVTISIFDHPSNTNFPAYWHARGYGLFAVNPLGRKIFTNGKESALNFTLESGESVTFRYRVLISWGKATAENTDAAYKDFVAAYR